MCDRANGSRVLAAWHIFCVATLWLSLTSQTRASCSGLHGEQADAGNPALSADDMLKHSTELALREHKDVLVIFTASWCHPCHVFLSFLTDPAMRPIFDRSFVTLVLTDGERDGDVRHHDTPGAHDLRTTFHAREAGLPYFAMLDGNGRKIVDSVRPVYGRRNERANVGYPGAASGREWFMEMMRLAVPSLDAGDRKTIEAWLEQHSGDGSQTQSRPATGP